MAGSLMTRFGVKNYKCLKEVHIPLTPIHVIIGQNDSGKTSLLEAMLAFFRSSQMQLARAFPGKWQGIELVFEGSPSASLDFEGSFKLFDSGKPDESEIEYGFQVDFSSNPPTCAGEWCSDTEDRGRAAIPQHHPNYTSVGLPSPKPSDVERRRVPILKNCLGMAHLYQLDPKMMATPATIDPARKFRLDPDGFGLPTLLDDILGYAPELFIELRNRFCEYFPQFRSVRLEAQEAAQRNYNETGVSSMGSGSGKGIFFETRAGRTIRAQQASDGAVLFLGFLAIISLPEPPNLILIEEPEKGVYPKRLDEIVKLLREVVEGGPEAMRPQLILSTHSPYLLSFFQPEEVTVMSRCQGGGVCARPLRDAPNIRERMDGEFYLGELWYNLGEEELFGGVPR